MTIEVHQFPAGPVIGFNGTTEWALDSVDQSQTLWVPAEHQLRELLGDAFAGLAPTGDGYRVTLRVDGSTSGHEGPDAADAYALALLHLMRSRARPMSRPGRRPWNGTSAEAHSGAPPQLPAYVQSSKRPPHVAP